MPLAKKDMVRRFVVQAVEQELKTFGHTIHQFQETLQAVGEKKRELVQNIAQAEIVLGEVVKSCVV